MNKVPFRILAVAAAVALSANASAESSFQTGAGALTATARIDFRITIPKILFLRVGTGTLFANNAGVDLIDFTPAATSLGMGSVAATAASGDRTNGAVTAQLVSNAGSVNLNAATTAGTLTDGAGNSIPYTKINVASIALAPAILPGAALWTFPGWDTPTVYTPAANSSTNVAAQWTFSYANDTVPRAGTYGGVNVNGGRVAFVASVL